MESDASSDSEGELLQSILKNYRKKAKCQSVLTQTKESQPLYQTGIYYEHDEREMGMSHTPNEKHTQTIISCLLKNSRSSQTEMGGPFKLTTFHIY